MSVQYIAGRGIDWREYDMRVRSLEDQGLTRSDAQGVVDAEMMVSVTAPVARDMTACKDATP